MGFLSQIVSGVVDAVESATGSEGSDAGNWAEEQAAAIEEAAGAAGEAAADAASDSAEFVSIMVGTAQGTGDHVKRTLGNWVADSLMEAGLTVPSRLDADTILQLVTGVGGLTVRRVEAKVVRMVGEAPVSTARDLTSAALEGGPAGVWKEVKEILVGPQEVKDARRVAGRVGVMLAERIPEVAAELAFRGGDDDAAAVLEAIRELLRRSAGKQGSVIQSQAKRADEERRKMIAELRHVVRLVGDAKQGPEPIPSRAWTPRQPARRQNLDSLELRRLSGILFAGAAQGLPQLTREGALRLASATNAAARGAVIQADLQLWLSMVRRLAGRLRVLPVGRPRVPGIPGTSAGLR